MSCSIIYNVFSEYEKLGELITLLQSSKSWRIKKRAIEADEVITNEKGEIIAVR